MTRMGVPAFCLDTPISTNPEHPPSRPGARAIVKSFKTLLTLIFYKELCTHCIEEMQECQLFTQKEN
jgi:hypothetical protein